MATIHSPEESTTEARRGPIDRHPTSGPQGLVRRWLGRALDVPVYLIQGANEADGRAVLADEWFAMLQAPTKSRIVLDTSGHRPIFEQPDEFHAAMIDVVLAGTGS